MDAHLCRCCLRAVYGVYVLFCTALWTLAQGQLRRPGEQGGVAEFPNPRRAYFYLFTSEQSKVLIYLLEYVCIAIMGLLLWRVETLQSLSESTPKASAPQTLPVVDIASLLKKNCENKHLYLQHDLSLSQLALATGTNHYYLSQYFTQQGLTYNAYINGLRIGHFISLYQKAVAEGRVFTAQQLASESGYRSYSTFSAASNSAPESPLRRGCKTPESKSLLLPLSKSAKVVSESARIAV